MKNPAINDSRVFVKYCTETVALFDMVLYNKNIKREEGFCGPK